jgi:methyl-accepting chemotaxis protein
MNNSTSWIDKILNKFSYTSKIRFILLCGYLPLVLLLVMNFVLLLHPLRNLKKQQEGNESIRQFNLLFEKMHDYLHQESVLSISKEKFWRETINEDLQESIQQFETWINVENGNQFLLEQFKIKASAFEEYWNQLSRPFSQIKSDSQASLIEVLFTSYGLFIEQISILSGLSFNLDTETSNLINLINSDLPETQNQILKIFLKKTSLFNDLERSKSYFNDFKLNEEKLISSMENLIDKGSKAIKSISLWVEKTPPDLLSDLNIYGDNLKQYFQLINEPFDLNHSRELSEYENKLFKESFKLNQKFQDLLQQALSAQIKTFTTLILKCFLILLIGGGMVAGLYVTRVIRHPLEKLVQAAQGLSQGNLAIRVPVSTNDEVALVMQSFNQMAEYFEEILRNAAKIIEEIFVTSTTISSFTREFELNMNSQERFVRQISSHAGSLQKGEEDFVDILQKANRVASITGSLVQMGHENLHEMESIMHEMLSASSNVVTTLSSLREKLVDINQVIFAIVKIADQSNLLSLNTAIRATKSGTEGRGFVIIADKIREMAEQIALATLNIEKVVEDIVSNVQVTFQEVDRFSSKILTQVKETTDIGGHLKHLIDLTQDQVKDFENINDGMQDQTKGIIAINQVINELRISVQESAFSVRKLYLEIEYLYESSHNLQEIIKKFKFTETKKLDQ